MAKEMTIIFVYDTQMIQKEEDDPASAILYFHPTWVSDQQKAALCGQLMGTIHCLKTIFSTPKIVALQSGKFFVIENGRYLLAIGTDRNIADWLLEHRANTLFSLVNFFHKDFVSLAEIYNNADSLSAKLYHLFETYVKMMFFCGNLFSHLPTLSLPKSASNVFTEAIHMLQCCQALNNVLGGSILYHNKVVATQLSATLTKKLVVTDPYRIKCPAETTEVEFDLPLGVQLLQVYITSQEYQSLLETSTRNRSIFQYFKNNKLSIKKPASMAKPSQQQEQVISTMKRDQSLIFTAVPEEEGVEHSISSFIPTAKKQRPKFLNLKSLSIDSSAEIKEKTKVNTPFCAQTSVCSTPLTDLKKFVHQNPLSICVGDADALVEENASVCTTRKWEKFVKEFVPPDITWENSLRRFNSNMNLPNCDFEQYSKTKNRCASITDPTFPVLKPDGKSVSKSCYESRLLSTTNPIVNQEENIPEEKLQQVQIHQKPIIRPNKQQNQEKRKSLTLPLKSLSIESSEQTDSPLINHRKYSGGVQLTPLMAKLSMLAAFEERSSGFCSRGTTPSGLITPSQPNFTFPSSSKFLPKKDVVKEEDDGVLEKCVLFVCGQQDVVLLLLLTEDGSQSRDVVTKLWELCTEELGKLEKQLNYSMESQPVGNPHESEPYSYLCLDADWDTTQRRGPWGNSENAALSSLHRDFNDSTNLMEILIRSSESVIYGYRSGQTQVFYQEPAVGNLGLPTPADPLGLVQLKAKRRLERDHAIILL